MDEYNYFRAWFRMADLDDVAVSQILESTSLRYYQNMKTVHDSYFCPLTIGGISARLAWAEAHASAEVGSESDLWEQRRDHYLLVQIREDKASKDPCGRFYNHAGQYILLAMKKYPDFAISHGLGAILSSTIIHAAAAMELCLKEVCKAASEQPAIKNRPPTTKQQDEAEKPRIFFLQQDSRGVARFAPPSVRPNFTSMGGCRMKYALAFTQDSADIDAAMASYDLDIVAQMRNVILHNGGMPDKLFRELTEGIPLLTSARALPDTAKIPLEGEFVGRVLSSSLNAVKRVVISVDQWLQRNK